MSRVFDKQPTEIVIDEHGAELWRKPYIFKRLSAVGDFFIENHVNYVVLSCTSDFDGTISTIVRKDKGTGE